MRLSQWLEQNNHTHAELADLIGNVTAEAVRLWAAGSRMPDTKNVLQIERATGGQVTVRDLHEARAEKLAAE
jgi:DNA-binding transcriptional regulator YdaS (Cro superfamily)